MITLLAFSSNRRKIDWDTELQQVVSEFQEQWQTQLFYKQHGQEKKKRFEFFKTLLHVKSSKSEVEKLNRNV